MTTMISNSQNHLQIPFHKLAATKDKITIIKNKAILNRKFFFSLLIILLIFFTSWTLLKQSPNAFQKPIDTKGVVILSLAVIFIAVNLYLGNKRLLRVISNFSLKKEGNLYINGKPIRLSNDSERVSVVIQDVAASGGVGGNYTVGVAAGKRFWGLCYELDEVDATKVAEFIANHLGFRLKTEKLQLFLFSTCIKKVIWTVLIKST